MSQAEHVELYEKHLKERVASHRAEERTSSNIGNARLVLALVAVTLTVLPVFVRQSWPWWTLGGLSFVFLWLGRWHDQVQSRARRYASGTFYYRRELDRIHEKWRDFPEDGSELSPVVSLSHDEPDAEQVELARLAGDLDVFGHASLFQLLNRAVTRVGQRTLSRWLLAGAPRDEVLARQAAVTELSGEVDFRERLFVAASGNARTELDPRALLEWAKQPSKMPAGKLLRVLGVAQPLFLLAVFAWFLLGGPPQALAVAILLQLGTIAATRKAVAVRLAALFTPDRALLRYAELIDVIESQKFESSRLVRVHRALETEGVSASERIRQLRRISERLEWSMNVFFALTIGPILLWDLNHVLQSERWQEATAGHLPGWFDAIGELEALASFAALKYERPEYAMPELVEELGVVELEGVTHPLLDHTQAKSNDLTLGGPGSVLLLSGSNMSGKSTLLRSVGMAVMMANAGAPVAVRRMRLSPIVLVTSIRVVDSLAHGTSHFYAELQRIKEALDKAKVEGARLLYLLDEMLHGTNSKERYVGAVSVIRWMSERKAMGIVTTHDLSVARVDEELPDGTVINRHFGDSVVGNEIKFDYVLREGPVETTNALRLMRAIGIDIPLSAPE